MGKVIIGLILMASLSGCTTGRPLGEAEEVWMSDASSFGTPSVYYCKANKDHTTNVVRPRCYRAEILSPQPQ